MRRGSSVAMRQGSTRKGNLEPEPTVIVESDTLRAYNKELKENDELQFILKEAHKLREENLSLKLELLNLYRTAFRCTEYVEK